MTTDSIQRNDPHASGHEEGHEHHETISIRVFGFWVYIMTDLVLFASLFAIYAVIGMSYAGGGSVQELIASGEIELSLVLVETFVLLASSFTIGLSMLAVQRADKQKTIQWLLITVLLGAVFMSLEIYEFMHLISGGHGPTTNGSMSAFFGLIGTHGLHVVSGVIWGLILAAQIFAKGLTENNIARISCLSLFWHFLHIVWICVFTVVYLTGSL